MNRTLRSSVLALVLLAAAGSVRAQNPNGSPFPYRIEAGANAYFRVTKPQNGYGGGQQLGPWYMYWPLEAHFQQVAPTNYPTWPQPMALPPNFVPPRPQQYQQPYPQFKPPAPQPIPQFVPPAPQPLPENGRR